MTNPIKIEQFKNCIPEKGKWYDHSGTIFISVMRKSKPYVRRKAIPSDNKIDNDLSEWHRIWQYENIELNYGTEQFGIKSYEITINVDNENHRIDSVVKNIAIEFQHTLSVSLDEMDLRHFAHSKHGLIPYLVLDLTNYTLSDFKETFKSEKRNPLKTRLNKWLTSKYSNSNRLFIDLKDGMIRIVNSVEIGFLEMSSEFFTKNLLQLENILTAEIKSDQIRALNKRERNTKLQKEAELRNIEKEKEIFYHEKFDNPDFKFYRFCFANPIIKPYVLPYNGDRFKYFIDSENENGYIEKWHTYYSLDSEFSIQYKTVTKTIEIQIQTYRGLKTKKEYQYLFAEIELKEKNKIIVKFKRNGNVVRILSEKEETLPF
ncbi:hypothetical protein [Aequorivita capsosiphonis]|uniref:hypothetical protein n=1 Tax=Aequorivita capsosiphonis TaxID=487317 RepID=UPI000403B94F|nr:hypothetical protein [Aequorivita capsosiphonis]